MEGSLASLLHAARAAYVRRDWADALDLFQQADHRAPLSLEDLERLMWSAGMLDRDADLLATCARLFEACRAAGNDARAAHWAFFHGFRQFALGEAGQATAWLQRARQLVEGLGRECAVSGYLLLPAIHKNLMAGDHEGAARIARQALQIGERCREDDLVAFAKCLLGRALVRQGKIDEGVPLLDESMLLALGEKLSPVITGLVYCSLIAVCRQIFALDRAREWTAALSQWCGAQPQLVQFNGLCLLHRAEIMELNGAWPEAVAEARRATQSLARASAAETEAGAQYQEGEIHRLRGEFDAAQACYRHASRLGLEPQPGLALLRLAEGQAEQAAATLRRVLATTTDPLHRARLLPAFVEILVEAKALDEAREACAELEAVAGRFATEILSAMALQARATILLCEGDPAAALARLRTASGVWQRAGAPYIQARLRVQAGHGCRLLGDAEGARLEYEAARATFEQLGAAPDLARTDALLAGPPRSRTADRLTQREFEVLALIAQGNTNKRIARSLGLSEKTIDRHVTNIFGKLDVSSRAAATAFAFQNGLL